jgi:hypothetical protein
MISKAWLVCLAEGVSAKSVHEVAAAQGFVDWSTIRGTDGGTGGGVPTRGGTAHALFRAGRYPPCQGRLIEAQRAFAARRLVALD